MTTKGDASLAAVDVASGEIIASVANGDRKTAKPHELTPANDIRHAVVSLYGTAAYGRNQPANRLGVVDLRKMRRFDGSISASTKIRTA